MKLPSFLSPLFLSASLWLVACSNGAALEDCSAPGDEDGNNVADCADAACSSVPACQPAAEDCNNGTDDDGDGAVDCADLNCATAEVCDGEDCTDGADNDGDGASDCDDEDCAADTACAELICNDATDNDLDGAVDCDDTDCANATNCIPEVACADGADNDQDGDTDCNDTDCAGDANCIPETCGNGALDVGEACDGADLAGQSCNSLGFVGGFLLCRDDCGFDTSNCDAPGCGNGVVEAGEACDDNNTLDGDGCSALCQLEGVLLEIEPNDDGNPNTGSGFGGTGNDFSASAAQALSLDAADGNALIVASINPSGDEDGFAISNTTGAPVLMTVETFGDAPGVCGTIDTVANIRNAGGTILATNDDIDAFGDVLCSLVSITLQPGQTLFVHTLSFGDTGVISQYFIEITFQTVSAEVEPNNTSATANAVAPGLVNAAIGVAGDDDFFSLSLNAGQTLTAEIVNDDCAFSEIESDLTLFATDGTTQLAFNDDIDFENFCSRVTFTATTTGTHFLRARASEEFDPNGTFDYGLSISVQ